VAVASAQIVHPDGTVTNWSVAAEIIKAVAGLVAVLGASLAYFTYRRSVRTKRAEWLASLHEKFFETDRYARIRRILDYRQEPEYSELAAAVGASGYHALADDLYRYLNFFELLASLRQLRQISDEEIVGLFDYDLRLLKQHRFIVDALRPQGFERLSALLQAPQLLNGS
jgi:hypothetical protein